MIIVELRVFTFNASVLELKFHSTIIRLTDVQFYAVPTSRSQVDRRDVAYNCDNENSQVSVVKLDTKWADHMQLQTITYA